MVEDENSVTSLVKTNEFDFEFINIVIILLNHNRKMKMKLRLKTDELGFMCCKGVYSEEIFISLSFCGFCGRVRSQGQILFC